jgi:hypothetical protein
VKSVTAMILLGVWTLAALRGLVAWRTVPRAELQRQ